MIGSEELDELEARFTAIVASRPRRYRWLYRGRWRYVLPLPWHTRLRLWFTGKVDSAAVRLADRGYLGAAETVWRLTGARNRRAK